jgi:hypothetical protein
MECTAEKPTKTCPYCAETVLKAALKCKHCGEFFDNSGELGAASTRRSIPRAPRSEGNGVDSLANGFAEVILFENPRTGQHREAPVGFSGTNLLFGFFVPLFRSDWKWAVIQFFAALFTGGLCWLVFPFIYNGLFIKDLEASGFRRAPNLAAPADAAEEAMKPWHQRYLLELVIFGGLAVFGTVLAVIVEHLL